MIASPLLDQPGERYLFKYTIKEITEPLYLSEKD